MMANSVRLQAEYYRLLEAYNLRFPPPRDQPFDPEGRDAEFIHKRFPDAPPEIIDRLREKLAARGKGFQEHLDRYAVETEVAIRAAGVTEKIDVFVGEFPTGSFNAQARVAANGFLVLINTGLIAFMYETANVMSWRVAVAEFDENGHPNEVTARGLSTFSSDQAVTALAKLITAYLTQGSVMAAGPSPFVFGGPQKSGAMFGAVLADRALRFAVAHEYGHILAGHLTSPRMVVTHTSVGDIELLAKSRDQELEADRIAFLLVLGGAPLVDSEEKLYDAQISIAGVMFFFAIDEMITHTVTRLTGRLPAVCDHPSSAVRMDCLRNAVQAKEHGLLFPFADVVVGLSAELCNDVADQVLCGILR